MMTLRSLLPTSPAGYLRLAWKSAPWLLAAGLGLMLWWRPAAPSAGAGAGGGTVTVAGEAALTPHARKWKRKRGKCKDEATGTEFKVVTREPSDAELERLALKYGARLRPAPPAAEPGVAPAAISELRGEPGADSGGSSADAKGDEGRVRPLSELFGEYAAPRMKYGGGFLAGLDVGGEAQFIFNAAPAPRFGWVGSWGAGAFYDLTSNSDGTDFAAEFKRSRVYGFVEPFQTKLVYWRFEGGAADGPEGWKPYVGVGAEFRTDGWHLKNVKGLKAVKLD